MSSSPRQTSAFPIPDLILVGLLAAQASLFLAERLGWFSFAYRKGWPVVVGIGILAVSFSLLAISLVASKRSRSSFRFGTRSLLLVTLLVATPCGWLLTQQRNAQRQQTAVQSILNSGGSVTYRTGPLREVADPPGPKALKTQLGEQFFADPVSVSTSPSDPFVSSAESEPGDFDDKTLMQLTDHLPDVERLDFTDSGFDDAALSHVPELTKLEELVLRRTPITDAGLQHLAEVYSLQRLNLDGTAVTDVGLMYLKALSNLKRLDLSNTKITGEGLVHLRNLHRLEFLVLDGTLLDDSGAQALQELTGLKSLEMSHTRITNDALEYAAALHKLGGLSFQGTGITDDRLRHLQGMNELLTLNLRPAVWKLPTPLEIGNELPG